MKLHEIIPLILPSDRNVFYYGDCVFCSYPDDDNNRIWDDVGMWKFFDFDVVRISGSTNQAGVGEVCIDIVAPID